MFNAKKIATSIAAAALMMGVSTSAFAAFSDLSLIRVVYERTTGTIETATDLGNVKTLIANGGTIAGTALSANTANNLYVAYFAVDRILSVANDNTPDFWVAGSTTTAPIAVGAQGFTTTKSSIGRVFSQYNSVAGGASVTETPYTLLQSQANSYVKQMSASQGAMNNMINAATRPTIEGSLSALVNGTATSLIQSLYFFSNANLAGSKAVEVAQIITNNDGSTTIKTTATPIPAAIYLMGSGLLGLVGIRRRKNA